jgi:hypothetical protein
MTLTLLLLLALTPPTTTLELPPSPGNPRNSEGAFLPLRDGRLLFAYTRFTGGASDHASGYIAARYSRDNGLTWSAQDETLLTLSGGLNIMSVSLLRLRSGAIALFALHKLSLTDCRPYLYLSHDEARTWSAPLPLIATPGYYVLNNDRVIQLPSGRLLAPVARHDNPSEDPKQFNMRGIVSVFYSDDEGRTWRESQTRLAHPDSPNGYQEPGLVALRDKRLLLFLRTSLGSQYFSHSRDGGLTWSTPQPSALTSPLSPASIKRIPGTSHLLAVWNDTPGKLRTPLTVAISRDEGRTWVQRKNIEADPSGWYCYTAIEFVGPRVLLSYVAGGRAGEGRLSRSVILLFDRDWLYR